MKELSLKLARNLWEETNSKIKSEVLARVEIFQPESEIAKREEKRALVDLAKAQAELERIQGIVSFRKTAGRDLKPQESADLVCLME